MDFGIKFTCIVVTFFAIRYLSFLFWGLHPVFGGVTLRAHAMFKYKDFGWHGDIIVCSTSGPINGLVFRPYSSPMNDRDIHAWSNHGIGHRCLAIKQAMLAENGHIGLKNQSIRSPWRRRGAGNQLHVCKSLVEKQNRTIFSTKPASTSIKKPVF
ncbi:hypothetical protein JKG47_19285 [Acidithiobacillus sp. MC6.1]|nr:hypothetical protein [Acidithiobacillus sp. MC6.1]